ncbi:MAG: endonuclease/exonuclease/phosphatase family protein [Bryobacterales bacterium]|nr:endonuclease/exonuclease/phosphatase family protein [Bryobacterales bacterium]
MDRRHFLMTPLAAQAAVQAAAQTRAGGLTSIAYNVLACLGFPRTRDNEQRFNRTQPQQPERMALELLLYEPDLVSFCESVTEEVAKRIAGRLGMTYAYFPPGVASYQGYPIGFPGTIFTKHRIVESQNAPGRSSPELYTRHWGSARVVAHDEEMFVFSAHLHPNDEQIREREISGILREIEKAMKTGRSVLFQGDLNHRPDGKEYRRWVDAGLVDTFAAKGAGPAYTSSPIEPTARIDYIWCFGPISARLREARCLFEGSFRTNPADPQSVALSDHLPVIAAFQ